MECVALKRSHGLQCNWTGMRWESQHLPLIVSPTTDFSAKKQEMPEMKKALWSNHSCDMPSWCLCLQSSLQMNEIKTNGSSRTPLRQHPIFFRACHVLGKDSCNNKCMCLLHKHTQDKCCSQCTVECPKLIDNWSFGQMEGNPHTWTMETQSESHTSCNTLHRTWQRTRWLATLTN